MTAFLGSLEDRVRGSDITQVATLVMAALVVTLVTVWPSTPGAVNESWYGFTQARAVILALLALGFGATAAREGARRGVATAVTVVLVSLLTIPLEVAAFAASYPAMPLWWPLLAIALAPAAYFALGLALGALAARLRLGALLPLLVPGVLVGLLVLDVRLGWTILNPLTAALQVSPHFALSCAVLSLLTLAWGVRRWRRGGIEEATP